VILFVLYSSVLIVGGVFVTVHYVEKLHAMLVTRINLYGQPQGWVHYDTEAAQEKDTSKRSRN
jgi:fermentation-respiration switch protein FrsA (DUF1100 family)